MNIWIRKSHFQATLFGFLSRKHQNSNYSKKNKIWTEIEYVMRGVQTSLNMPKLLFLSHDHRNDNFIYNGGGTEINMVELVFSSFQ